MLAKKEIEIFHSDPPSDPSFLGNPEYTIAYVVRCLQSLACNQETIGASHSNALARTTATTARIDDAQVTSSFGGTVAAEQKQTYEKMVDGGRTSFIVSSASGVQVQLREPGSNGRVITPITSDSDPTVAFVSEGSVRGYIIQNAVGGNWTIEVIGPSTLTQTITYDGAIMVFDRSIQIQTATASTYTPSQPITVSATLMDATSPIASAAVQAEMRDASGNGIATRTMLDNGQQGDGSAGDGVYGATFDGLAQEGSYTVHIKAAGSSTSGQFERTDVVLIRVAAPVASPTPTATVTSTTVPPTPVPTGSLPTPTSTAGPTDQRKIYLPLVHR